MTSVSDIGTSRQKNRCYFEVIIVLFSREKMSNDFYLRYYVGHKGKFGHEFLEFEFRPDGKLRSAPTVHFSDAGDCV